MAKRTNNDTMRTLAERMFVVEGMTAKAIAETVGVTQHTIGRWRKGIGEKPVSWDDLRRDYLTAPHNLKKVLMDELQKVAEGNDPNINVKALADINKVLDSLTDKVSVQLVFTVFKEFDNWMAKQDPEIAISFLEWHKLFLHHKALQK